MARTATTKRQLFGLVILLTAAALLAPHGKHKRVSAHSQTALVRAEGRGLPYINLRDSYALPNANEVLAANLARPLALAAGDFDGDGITDLAAGYASECGMRNAECGMLAVWQGNGLASTVENPHSAFRIPHSADFMAAGDFDNDGHADLLTAARGGTAFQLLRGDGRGNFSETQSYAAPGRVTALATGEINRADGLPDVVVGLETGAAVWSGPDGALKAEPQTIRTAAPVTALALGALDDDGWYDLALAVGPQIVVSYGHDQTRRAISDWSASVPACHERRARKNLALPLKLRVTEGRYDAFAPLASGTLALQSLCFDAPVAALAVGDFADGNQTDIAALDADGALHIFAPQTRTRPIAPVAPSQNVRELHESKSGVTFRVNTGRAASSRQPAAESVLATRVWREVDRLALFAPGPDAQLVRAKVSSHPHDDLLLTQRGQAEISVITQDGGPRVSAALTVENGAAAVLPVRLNGDALHDLVVLSAYQNAPAVVLSAPAATFTVTNANDTGAGSLRRAITDANNSPGADTIAFNIGSGLQTIQLQFDLPAVSDTVFLDGETQPGFSGNPLIQLTGNDFALGCGLDLRANNVTVRGFVINRFQDGLNVASNGNIIQNNFVGTDPNGTTARGNRDDGIFVDRATNNTIGGTTLSAFNLVAANGLAGIRLFNAGAVGNNDVIGNQIGTVNNSAPALGNRFGVVVSDSKNNRIGTPATGADNDVHGNFGDGILIEGLPTTNTASGNLVQQNRVGVFQTLTPPIVSLAIPNVRGFPNVLGAGVRLLDAPGNTVGGTAANARNVISGNLNDGVQILATTGAFPAMNNLVQGNFLGASLDGANAVPNRVSGILIGDASGNKIGEASPSDPTTAANVLSGNPFGVAVVGFSSGVGAGGPATRDNEIRRNFIGTRNDGETPLPNDFDGVYLEKAVNTNLTRNTISGNNRDGVHITGPQTTGNMLSANVIGPRRDTTSCLSNGGGNVVAGVTIENANGNFVGTAEGGNLIGCNANGIVIATNAANNILRNNTVGRVPIGNNSSGIVLESGARDNQILDGNFIFFNGDNGVLINGPATTRNIVQRSEIRDNRDWGVSIINAPDNQIGGRRDGVPEGNTIRGNGVINDPSFGGGVLIRGNSAQLNRVQGNVIGLNEQMSFAQAIQAGNHGNGVRIENATLNLIGGEPMDVFFNIISGNGWVDGLPGAITPANAKFASGVLITGGGGNEVRGNIIGGVSPGGTSGGNGQAMPNVTNGLMLENSNDNLIGSNDDGVNPVQFIAGNGLGILETPGVRDDLANVIIEGGARNRVRKNFVGVNNSGQFLQRPPGTEFVAFFLFGLSAGGVSDTQIGCPRNPALLIPFCNRIVGLAVGGANVRVQGNLLGGRNIPNEAVPSNSVSGGVTVGGTQPFEGNTIAGNLIGLKVSGPGAFVQGNVFDQLVEVNPGEFTRLTNIIGIEANGGVLIGGEDPNAKNVIRFSTRMGIRVLGEGAMITGNEIRNNATGAGGNSRFAPGIEIGCGESLNFSPCEAVNNIARNTTIRLNDISDNANSGIAIRAGAKNSFIGLNRIHNNLAGVTIDADVTVTGVNNIVRAEGHRISENSIFNNVGTTDGLGLDLDATGQQIGNRDGVTFNDINPSRQGPNELQGFPGLVFVTSSASGTHIRGIMLGEGEQQYRIEFFRNSVCDDTLDPRPNILPHGEGEEFLTFRIPDRSRKGDISFNLTIPQIVQPGQFLTATATNIGNNNTSEFSRCVEVKADSDGDGLGDEEENAAPNNGDGNNDGIPDRQQKNVSSVRNAANGQFATLVAPAGTELVDVAARPNPARGELLNAGIVEQPPNVAFPVGFFEFTVRESVQSVQGYAFRRESATPITPEGVTLNATVTVIHHGAAQNFTAYHNNGPEPSNATPHWYDFAFNGATGATFNGNAVTLRLVDGARGDHDGATDGKITTFGGPAVPLQNPSEVSVTKSGPASVSCGQQISYTLQIPNAGANAAANVLAFDPLPACLSNISCQTTHGACEVGNQSVTTRLASLPAGATATVTINATAGAGCGATLTNQAILEADNDANPANNVAATSAPFACAQLPDVTISKTGPPSASCGASFDYTLTAQNVGLDPANNVSVTDNLPACLSNISCAASAGTCAVNGNTVTANLGNLAGGANATVTINAQAGAGCAASITNTANITASNDSNPSNNTAQATTNINCVSVAVTNTNDSGPGSLREALNFANQNPGTLVRFNIPTTDPNFSGGVFTITPATLLPDVTANGTIIDGATQAAFLGTDPNPLGPDVVINCNQLPDNFTLLRITAAGCVFKDLSLRDIGRTQGTQMTNIALLISGSGATGNRVQGCYVSISSDGQSEVGLERLFLALRDGARNNLVGGMSPTSRNLFAGFSAVLLQGAGANDNRVQGNYFGLNASGTTAISMGGVSIEAGAQNNLIGGAEPGARNIFAPRTFTGSTFGVLLRGAGTDNNRVQGNYFGLNPSGTAGLGSPAMRIEAGAQNNLVGGTGPGEGNVFSGAPVSGTFALDILGLGTENNRVQGNLFGTDATGTRAITNGFLSIANEAHHTLLGGLETGARNIFARTTLSISNASNNVVQGNFIGTDITGTRAVDDTGASFLGRGFTIIADGNIPANDNLIGGPTVAARNIINSSAGPTVIDFFTDAGVFIRGRCERNKIQGNFLGADVNGVAFPQRSFGSGIALIGFPAISNGNEIGGAANSPGTPPGNLIKNGLIGVYVTAPNTLIQGNRIEGMIVSNGSNESERRSGIGIVLERPQATVNLRGNSITGNARLGIDLITFSGGGFPTLGVTPNDNCDADTGAANNLQNFPAVTSAVTGAGGTALNGTLNSTANGTYTIEFFANSACDSSGNGEGEFPLGTTIVTTDAACNGAFNFNVTLPAPVPAGRFITATATDAAGNTSEFSACRQVTSGGGGTTSADLALTHTVAPDPAPLGATLTYTLTLTNNGPDAANSITVNDNLPAQLTFVSCNATSGGVCGGTGNNRTITFASLANGATATGTLTATINSGVTAGTIITNTATATTTTPDPNPSNNTATTSVTVVTATPTPTPTATPTATPTPTPTPTATPTPSPTPTPGPPQIKFSAAAYSGLEECGGGLRATVLRTGDASGPARVDFLTSDGTAQQRTDYTILAGTLTFAPGETSQTVVVPVTEDVYVEGGETLTLTLSNAVGAALVAPDAATLTISDDDTLPPNNNPVEEAQVFACQHYHDFLSREPDGDGLAYWTNELAGCGTNEACYRTRRIGVSAAFFIELEYQESAAYVYRLYKAAFGEQTLYRPSYAQFIPDRARVVGGANLNAGKLAFAQLFVARAEFLQRYPANLSAAQFVDAVLATVQQGAGVTFTTTQRDGFIADVNAGGRGLMLKNLGDNAAFAPAVFNRAFVLAQYFGYLRRDPDQAGYEFWLNILNQQPNNFRGMVCAFITSQEYQERFSSISPRSNAECASNPLRPSVRSLYFGRAQLEHWESPPVSTGSGRARVATDGQRR